MFDLPPRLHSDWMRVKYVHNLKGFGDMKMVICAVRDSAVQAFGRPFVVQARGQAIRSFQDECKNESSDIAKHPSDYDLYVIGEFNDENGEITPQVPQLLLRAVDATLPKPE